MEIFLDRQGNQVVLTFDQSQFQTPGHVLVVPVWKGKLVMTNHKKRGIELPGGKIEAGETPLAAAVREVYEETGASLQSIQLVGQYAVAWNGGEMIKSIYAAEVAELLPLPAETDTFGAIVLEELPVQYRHDPAFSDLVKDEVFPRTLQFLGLWERLIR